MNFTEDMDDSLPIGKKTAVHKGAEDQQEVADGSKLDADAMDMAQKSQARIHHNEETNSSNTTFSK